MCFGVSMGQPSPGASSGTGGGLVNLARGLGTALHLGGGTSAVAVGSAFPGAAWTGCRAGAYPVSWYAAAGAPDPSTVGTGVVVTAVTATGAVLLQACWLSAVAPRQGRLGVRVFRRSGG